MSDNQHLLELEPVDAAIVAGVPSRIKRSIDGFVHHGSHPGEFLMAVLRNDLMDAICRADPTTLSYILAICCYVQNAVPMSCYGTTAKIRYHMRRGLRLLEASE